MNQLSTLPSSAEQARHALLLLGAPAPVRLLVDVHAALFDGDLSVPALAGLVRDRTPGFCAALNPDLTPARGLVALADWPLERRIVTPAGQRAGSLAMILRIAEFVAIRPWADRSADRLLRALALDVPHGPEALDLAEAARAALSEPRLVAAVAAETPIRAAAVRRAAELDESQQLFGRPTVPHQRGGE
ncbi:hypothetical protein ACWKSP_08005 [Micromonosporaceae bacterium Da 78-11]